MDGDHVLWCYPLRRPPCGSTDAAARELNGQVLHKDTLNRFALSICHNCRTPRFGKTCDKEKAGFINLEELLRALKGINPELWREPAQVIEKGGVPVWLLPVRIVNVHYIEIVGKYSGNPGIYGVDSQFIS